MRPETYDEIWQVLLLMAGMGFVFMVPIVWISGRLIALKERPRRRAAWTTVPAYIFASIVPIGGNSLPIWVNPLVQVPVALLVYLWLLNTYRKGWIDDDQVPEGTVLENSDWRVGLLLVAALVGVVLGRMAVRALLEMTG